MTWLYALVQLVDMRFWHSGVARRRRLSLGIPESLIAWLFGQMLAWFGIIYYALHRGRALVRGRAVVVLADLRGLSHPGGVRRATERAPSAAGASTVARTAAPPAPPS